MTVSDVLNEGVKERPILFSGPMARALLDGRKTQTRRVVKPMPKWAERFPICAPENMAAGHQIWWWDGEFDRVGVAQDCPYGKPGARLWVREAHAIYHAHGQHRSDGLRWGPWGHLPTRLSEDRTQIAYYREGFDRCDPGKWRPSIHMPRWACRLVLEITDVRVERLLDCSDADAQAEGLQWVTPGMWSVDRTLPIIGDDARQVYFQLWDHINGAGAAHTNPWVWAVSFRVLSDDERQAARQSKGAE